MDDVSHKYVLGSQQYYFVFGVHAHVTWLHCCLVKYMCGNLWLWCKSLDVVMIEACLYPGYIVYRLQLGACFKCGICRKMSRTWDVLELTASGYSGSSASSCGPSGKPVEICRIQRFDVKAFWCKHVVYTLAVFWDIEANFYLILVWAPPKTISNRMYSVNIQSNMAQK